MLSEIDDLHAQVRDGTETLERERQYARDDRNRAETEHLRRIKQLEHQCKYHLTYITV